jgi:ArsR family transcriptional regulator
MVKPTETLPKAFSALGDSTRFQLFKLLSTEKEICVSQLAEKLNISPACVSQHMKVLADAGLVTRAREGQKVCYEISTDSPDKKLLNELIFKTN